MNKQRYLTKSSFALAAIVFGLLLGRGDAAGAQQSGVRVAASDSVVANHPVATVSLPAPYKVVGGGARANWRQSGSLLTQSQPGAAGPNSWTVSSKDHFDAEPISITAFAIGLADPADEWEVIVRESRSPVAAKPVATASLPPGYVMTGGGCLDDWRTSPSAAGNLLTGSFPSSASSWECRGQEHGAASPASIVAYVIGIRSKTAGAPLPEVQITSATSEVGAHVMAIAPAVPGFVITGGGAVTGGASLMIPMVPRPMAERTRSPGPVLPPPPVTGQLLTATFPEVAAGSAVASGWRATAKDHMYASPGTVTAYAVNLRFAQQPVVTLRGWVDLHTHPMSHLAFGGKVFHGAPDVGSIVPAADKGGFPPGCIADVRATTMEAALSNDAPTHGDFTQSPGCGDSGRRVIVTGIEGKLPHEVGNRVGAPAFTHWPRWDDLTHQKMWVDWIRRAYGGGLRVMVALSHNNRTLADVVGAGGPISGVTDDQRSSDLQIAEMKAFVGRHADFMEVALNAADVFRIVQANKLAVVLGVEIDNIGNLNQIQLERDPDLISSLFNEIYRLYGQGIRYIFPIHLTDNVLGGSAIYMTQSNWANYRESMWPSRLAPTSSPGSGNFFQVQCAAPGDDIGFKFETSTGGSVLDGVFAGVRHTKLGIPPTVFPPRSPDCPAGHRNAKGLTSLGELALKQMMRLGMIIDVDHMSHNAVERALQIAESVPGGGYPLVSGHSGIRAQHALAFNAENSRTRAQLGRIACLQGMFGLGTDGAEAYDWASQYVDAWVTMNDALTRLCPYKSPSGVGSVAFGTDANSLVKLPRPSGRNSVKYDSAFPKSRTGSREWDYNTEGVAHYGMFADFIQDVRTAPANRGISGAALVDDHLFRSADYFWRMWQRIEAQAKNVR